MKKRDQPDPQPPRQESNPKVTEPKRVAGGWDAIQSSIQHATEAMGPGRTLKTLSQLNQKRGFDCPGCAWPDPEDERSLTEFCENGVKAVAEEATQARIGKEFFETWSVKDLSQKSDHWLGKQGRLTEPMVLLPNADHYRPISWEDAFSVIAEALNDLASPDQAVFYTSGRTSNEAAFLYQLMVRELGTNNLPDCSNMCHESSGVALTETIGIGKGTVTLEDVQHADLILVIGQNPGTNHPRMLSALQKTVKNGGKIIAINPLKEAGLIRFQHPQNPLDLLGKGTQLTSQYLQVKINGDVALLKGITKSVLEDFPHCIQKDFIRDYCEGFEAFKKDLELESWDTIIAESGISKTEIQKVAETFSQSKRVIGCWAMGLTQHKNAVANIQSIVNLLLLGGHLGRPGAGVCPVRGHSNVQGDRTMGIYEKPHPRFLDALESEFQTPMPRVNGYDTVDAIRAMSESKVRVFMAMGGNFLSATPDTELTAEALSKTELTIQVSTKLNRSHLITGKSALILPCLGRTERDRQASGEQFVTMENSMGIVHPSTGSLTPASPQLKSEVAIICELAQRRAPQSKIPWSEFASDYQRIRDRVARVVPGFEDYNQRVRTPGGFYLPNPVRDQLEFLTPSGKAQFTTHSIPRHSLGPEELLMMTIRTHDQYNTTIYGLEDRYRGISGGRRVVLIHPDDITAQGFQVGDRVNLHSRFQSKTRTAENFQLVSYDIPRGCVATYFPETNVLVPLESYADKSQTPTSKSVVITLSRMES